ncbi:MAG TPA: flagellar biosynthesis protein FlhB [Paucimonas sp.]|nr:flagellar biosynthesis protein FlhB [Paucimonas sp.]
MAEQDSDRSEEATPYKLEQARKKGMVARSTDFTAMAILAALVVTLYANGWSGLKQVLRLQLNVLGHAGQLQWGANDMMAWISSMMYSVLQILAPLFLAVGVTAVLASLIQTGPIFSAKPLAPDMSRINPATGFKRLFSLRTLYEALKSTIKLLILAVVAYMAIRDALPGLAGISALEPKGYAKVLLGLSAGVLVKLVLALLVIALVDLAYTRWEFAQRMRMSRRDVRDEIKNREGDPRIRSRLRELRMEMLKRSKAMRNLPSADVLITNPTHLAVALSYKHGEAGAPKLVAKGAGDLARKMRQVASRHHIPVVQNKPLARALYKEIDYDNFVPEKFYAQLAKIMVWVYTMREARQSMGGAA